MDILFWSGGKDSYLALEFYRKEYESEEHNLQLLTTYDKQQAKVPHQEIELNVIREQAKKLNRELIEVPLPPECPNDQYLKRIHEALLETAQKIRYLVFGDWKLEDIRSWREKEFGRLGYDCLFPIWKKSLNELLPILMLKPVKVTISAVREEYRNFIAVGETYNQHFIRQLPEEIDPMGEHGEFHTRVNMQSFDDVEPERQPLF